MRIVFMGSASFSLPTLAVLADGPDDVVAVITQPDRPAGRGHAATAPPVKVAALERGLTVLQPPNVSAPESVEVLRGFEADVFVVAAYGQILRQRVLDLPKRGSLNVHASLLPRHRGASPITAAILAGDTVTGVTVMEVVRALDAGPMVAKVEVPIAAGDTTGTLEPKLAAAGAELLARVIEPWAKGEIVAAPQDDALATYAPMLKREDALIDWTQPAAEIERRVRAFNPWPIAYTRWRGNDLRILEAHAVEVTTPSAPGKIVESAAGTLTVATGKGLLSVVRLQPAGKKALTAEEFLRGQRDFVDTRLGD